MAQVNKISSFKSFTEIRKQESVSKLREENNSKRQDSVGKIAAILDELGLTSFEGLEEDQKQAIISKIFGDVSEEEIAEIEVEVEDVTESVVNESYDYDEVAQSEFGMDYDQLGKSEKEWVRDEIDNMSETNGSVVTEGSEKEDAKEIFDELMDVNGEEIADMDSQEAMTILSKRGIRGGKANKIAKELLKLTGAINEAIAVEGKRGAKKVFTAYRKIMDSMPGISQSRDNNLIKGCIKVLGMYALEDANFHREMTCMNKIKGSISPVEIKVAGLANMPVKVSVNKIKDALQQVTSKISLAGDWTGIAIAEGTALFLDSIGATKDGQAMLDAFNSAFESTDNGTENMTVESLILEGTRGQFGKIDNKGNITSVYTHYDSYPDNMLPIIKKSFKGGKNVDTVLSKGANSGLDSDISKINFYGDGSVASNGNIKKIDLYLSSASDDGAEYVYLWDEKSKKWMMADIYGKTGLVPAFESVVNEMKKRSPYVKDDLVYNTRTETVGIVRTDDDGSGEVKTDADGNVNVDELEVYMPFKYNYKNAKIAPSTKKEVIKRRLFYPFNESLVNEAAFKKGQYIKAKSDSDDFDGDVYDKTNDVDGSEILKNSSFEIYEIGKDEVILWSDADEVEYSIDPDDLKNFVKESVVTEKKEEKDEAAEIEAEIEKLTKENKHGYAKDIKRLKVRLSAVNMMKKFNKNNESKKVAWDNLLEEFEIVETTNEGLRSDVKNFIKDNKDELNDLADNDEWDMMYQKLYDEFGVESDTIKAKDLLKTFQFVF